MKTLRHVAIVGGGTAGWSAALSTANLLTEWGCKITLIEAPEIPSIGVGESTIPTFINFLTGNGIDLKDFIQHTDATFKLGIEFSNWAHPGHHFFHPFDRPGTGHESFDLYLSWLYLQHQNQDLDLTQISPAAMMATHNKFAPPESLKPPTLLSNANYALHFDASLTARYLRKQAELKGVRRIEAQVASAEIEVSSGDIARLWLSTGDSLDADFFFDCTGFRAGLIEKVLGVGFDSWSDQLLCDRAVVVQSTSYTPVKPYTRSIASSSGWLWKIPLQQRQGNGHVYSSNHISDDEAIHCLTKQLEDSATSEARVIRFKVGKRRQIWHKNCLALGLSAGFVEPLESTAIHLVTRTLQLFLRYLPASTDNNSALQKQFNKRINEDFAEIRDFITLHYTLSRRKDSAFWRDSQNVELSSELRDKLELFYANASIAEGIELLFKLPSWYALLLGMGIKPQAAPTNVLGNTRNKTFDAMKAWQQRLQKHISCLPTHEEFIQQHCPSRV